MQGTLSGLPIMPQKGEMLLKVCAYRVLCTEERSQKCMPFWIRCKTVDILCVGMYRSCSTWQYNIACELAEAAGEGIRLGFVLGADYASHASLPYTGLRVLKSHDGHESFASALRTRHARAVYSMRDLRDVVFSLMHKWQITFDEVVAPGGLLESCIANHSFWTSLPNVLCQRYETIVSDPQTAVKQIASHLNTHTSDEDARRLAIMQSFPNIRKRVETFAETLRARGLDLENPCHALLYDTDTLLHWNHLRSGKVGEWRHRATVYQATVLTNVCGPWLSQNGYVN